MNLCTLHRIPLCERAETARVDRRLQRRRRYPGCPRSTGPDTDLLRLQRAGHPQGILHPCRRTTLAATHLLTFIYLPNQIQLQWHEVMTHVVFLERKVHSGRRQHRNVRQLTYGENLQPCDNVFKTMGLLQKITATSSLIQGFMAMLISGRCYGL